MRDASRIIRLRDWLAFVVLIPCASVLLVIAADGDSSFLLRLVPGWAVWTLAVALMVSERRA